MRARNKVASRARRKKLLKSAKGYFLKRSKNIRRVKETRRRALKFAFRDRKAKKREFKSLWITRINAAAQERGLSYKDFIHRLKAKDIIISKNILAKIAAEEQKVFDRLMNFARIHADAGSLSARPMLSEILFISFAIEQEKKIIMLEKKVEELEETIKGKD